MLKFARLKLYRNHLVDLRSYEIDKCNDKGVGCIISHKGEKMTLTLDELKTRCVDVRKNVPSVVNKGQVYDLHSYEWNPDVD